MIRRLALPLIALAVVATACAETPAGPADAENPDIAFARGGRPFLPGEQQPVLDLGRGPRLIYPEDQGQNLSQTFTPPKNQVLGFLEIPVACFTDVLLNVKIREGLGGPLLYEVNISGLPVPPTVLTFQLLQVYDPAVSRGIRLRKDRTYAFELASFPADPNVPNPTCVVGAGPAGDSYPRGEAFFEDVPINGPGWLPLGEDLPFITLVR